jgi:hypothetical protein
VPANAVSISNGNIQQAATIIPPPGLTPQFVNSATAAVNGQCTVTVGPSTITVTLPTHAAGQTVGVLNLGASITTVAGTNIQGLGLSSATSFKVASPGACVVLLDDGTNWNIIAGQQDTGWVAFGVALLGIAAGGYPIPSYRIVGDRVWLKGGVTTTSSGGIATLAAAIRPPFNTIIPIAGEASSSTLTATNGLITASSGAFYAGFSASYLVSLEGSSYSLN